MKDAVEALWSVRNRYSKADTARKRAFLTSFAATLPRSSRDRRRLHDTLLFLLAHPDSAALFRLADQVLASLNESLDADTSDARALDGIAGSTLSATFTFDAARWLATRLGEDVDVDWSDDEANARLERLLPLLIAPAERDGLGSPGLTTEEWVRLASGSRRAVRWILDRFEETFPDARTRDHIWDGVELPFQWHLRAATSRSGARLLPRKAATFPRGLTRTFDAAKEIARTAPKPQRLRRTDAERVIRTVRTSMFSRERETDAVTYANADEVYRVEIEHGVDVYLFGLEPDRRLGIETFIGYIATRNSLPVAYGAGWVFLDRCETGINVLEEFRSGESAWLYAQILRVYRHTFDVRRFHVDPYQIGEENGDAIRSGAFWFYYRLGFRPADRELAARADEEARRIAKQRGHRTPARLLRHFASEPVTLALGGCEESVALDALGVALTCDFASGRSVSRRTAQRLAARELARRLDVDADDLNPQQRAWFTRLSPLFVRLDLDDWPKRDRARLRACLLAKGDAREMDYALGLRKLSRLPSALDVWVRRRLAK